MWNVKRPTASSGALQSWAASEGQLVSNHRILGVRGVMGAKIGVVLGFMELTSDCRVYAHTHTHSHN